MAIGNYGTVRAADVAISDIDMFYTYSPDRETENSGVFRLDSEEVLSYNYLPDDEQIADEENLLSGLYNLKLPADVFNQLGFYNIYMKPKQLSSLIIDCSVLSSLPTVKGIVLDINSLSEELQANGALLGYLVEYINTDGNKLRNVSRYVVSSNRVVPVSQNVGNTSQRAIRYRFDDSGSLLFLQLTPSSSSDVKPNQFPFIGTPGQTVLLSNTNFTPVSLEVELVENTIDTIANIVAGEQIKDVDNGILTYFDKDRNITNQYDLYEIKNDINDATPTHEVKEKRDSIDETQTFDNIE